MSATRRIVPAVFVAVALAVALLLWPDEQSPEDAVRETIREVADAAERAHANDVMAHVATDYRDEDGLDHKSIKAFLVRQFMTRGGLSIVLGPILVDIHAGDSAGGRFATARFDAVLAENTEGVMGWDGEGRKFTVELRLDPEAGWQILSQESRAIGQ